MKQRRQLELEQEAAKKKRLVVTIDLMGRKVNWEVFLACNLMQVAEMLVTCT